MNPLPVSVFDKCDEKHLCVNVKQIRSEVMETLTPNYLIKAHGDVKYKKKGTVVPQGIVLVLYTSPGTPIGGGAASSVSDYLTTRRDEKMDWESFQFDNNTATGTKISE